MKAGVGPKDISLAELHDATAYGELHQAGVLLFAKETGGQLDLLFNCAGILFMGLHENIGLENQKKTLDINLMGTLNLIHACLPLLEATKRAAIINMSSASAVYGTLELAVYSATKHAIRGLSDF